MSEKAVAPYSSTLAWKIPWMEKGAWWAAVHGVARVGHDWATLLSLFTFHFHALKKEMATHSSVLAWRVLGMGEPGGLPSMMSHRVRYDWSNLAAAAAVFNEYLLSEWAGEKVNRKGLQKMERRKRWCHPCEESSERGKLLKAHTGTPKGRRREAEVGSSSTCQPRVLQQVAKLP